MASLAFLAAGAFLTQRFGGRKASAPARAGLCRRAAGADSVEDLLAQHGEALAKLKAAMPDLPKEYDDTKLLRYCLQHKDDSTAAVVNLKEVIAWRAGEGAVMVAAAAVAVEKAKAGGKWDNEPVNAAAPHIDRIGKYITNKAMVVVPGKMGDLITCIQAASINSEAMMKEVSVEDLTEFFIYAREVNSMVADQRTRATGKLVKLVAANDLTGVSSFPDKDFQTALTGSAKKAVTLYPGYSGPTVILNLPWVARLLVQFLTPLFPGAVRDKIKFAKGPMAYLENLMDILQEPTKSMFADDFQAVLDA